MILIQQYYDFRKEKCPIHTIQCGCLWQRQKEIDYCLKKNIENKCIDKIIFLNEESYQLDILNHEKVQCINIGKRLSYQEAIRYIKSLDSNDKFILANNDIFFDNTLEIAENQNLHNKIIALTRHEFDGDSKLEQFRVPPMYDKERDTVYKVNRCWSHDAWILDKSIPSFRCEFLLGVLGCENAFISAAITKKINIENGYPYIRANHFHKSKIRIRKFKSYTHSDKIRESFRKDIYGKELNMEDDFFKISDVETLKILLKNINQEDVYRAASFFKFFKEKDGLKKDFFLRNHFDEFCRTYCIKYL